MNLNYKKECVKFHVDLLESDKNVTRIGMGLKIYKLNYFKPKFVQKAMWMRRVKPTLNLACCHAYLIYRYFSVCNLFWRCKLNDK